MWFTNLPFFESMKRSLIPGEFDTRWRWKPFFGTGVVVYILGLVNTVMRIRSRS